MAYGIARLSSEKNPQFKAEVVLDGPGDAHKVDRRYIDLCRRHGQRPQVVRLDKDGKPAGYRPDERVPGRAPDDLRYEFIPDSKEKETEDNG